MAQWNPQVNELFLKAREISSPEDRRAFLDQACGGDADLSAKVEALLQAGAQAGSFLEAPAVARHVVHGNGAARHGVTVRRLQDRTPRKAEDLRGFWFLRPDGSLSHSGKYLTTLLQHAGGKLHHR